MFKKIKAWFSDISTPPVIKMSVWEKSIREEPEQWYRTRFCLVHSSGAELWISNGKDCLRPYPSKPCSDHFSQRDKERIWEAYLWWSANTPLELQAEGARHAAE